MSGTTNETIARLEREVWQLRGSVAEWWCARCGERGCVRGEPCPACGNGPVEPSHAVERRWAELRSTALRGILESVMAVATVGIRNESRAPAHQCIQHIRGVAAQGLAMVIPDQIVRLHAALQGVEHAARDLVTQYHDDGCECPLCAALALAATATPREEAAKNAV